MGLKAKKSDWILLIVVWSFIILFCLFVYIAAETDYLEKLLDSLEPIWTYPFYEDVTA